MMNQEAELASARAEIQRLQEENRRLIACAEELEFEASRKYCALTTELRDSKAAYQDISQKYEFSNSHYHMTQRHADNLQSLLDAREEELRRTHCHAENLQGLLDSGNQELMRLRSYADKLQTDLNHRDLELLQLRCELDSMQNAMNLQREELQQTRRHANNLQSVQAAWDTELMLARRHAENLQQILDAKAQKSVTAKLSKAKERVQGWIK